MKQPPLWKQKHYFKFEANINAELKKNHSNIKLNCVVVNIDNMEILFTSVEEMVTNQIPLKYSLIPPQNNVNHTVISEG